MECKFEIDAASNNGVDGLNRNILECKLFISSTSYIYHICLNRNILECKYGRLKRNFGIGESLNRNILECKWISSVPRSYPYKVLIETYWNVNCRSWKVGYKNWSGLNRNILECKSFLIALKDAFERRLNRNILECKFKFWIIWTINIFVLIETYWNVNLDLFVPLKWTG